MTAQMLTLPALSVVKYTLCSKPTPTKSTVKIAAHTYCIVGTGNSRVNKQWGGEGGGGVQPTLVGSRGMLPWEV